MNAIKNRVISLVSKVLRRSPDSIMDSSGLRTEDGWNSLEQLTLLVALEQEFNCVIDPEIAADLISIAAICAFLQTKGSK